MHAAQHTRHQRTVIMDASLTAVVWHPAQQAGRQPMDELMRVADAAAATRAHSQASGDGADASKVLHDDHCEQDRG
jgi:hypothetical protein